MTPMQQMQLQMNRGWENIKQGWQNTKNYWATKTREQLQNNDLFYDPEVIRPMQRNYGIMTDVKQRMQPYIQRAQTYTAPLKARAQQQWQTTKQHMMDAARESAWQRQLRDEGFID